MLETTLFTQHQTSDSSMYVIGTDEAGRGPLAGPVFIGCVCFSHPQEFPEYIKDSKMLSAEDRVRAYEWIRKHALFAKTIHYSPKKIDSMGIYECIKDGMTKLIKEAIQIKTPHWILTDAVPVNIPNIPLQFLHKGDQKSWSIAAASILAKHERDQFMKNLDVIYPEYGFSTHMGYPTKQHQEALKTYGPTKVHRKSFRLEY